MGVEPSGHAGVAGYGLYLVGAGGHVVGALVEGHVPGGELAGAGEPVGAVDAVRRVDRPGLAAAGLELLEGGVAGDGLGEHLVVGVDALLHERPVGVQERGVLRGRHPIEMKRIRTGIRIRVAVLPIGRLGVSEL